VSGTAYLPPQGLGEAGLALWRRLTDGLEYSEGERVTLELACRQADDVALVERTLAADGPLQKGSKGQPKLHAGFGELRLQRAALARLIAALAIPAEDAAEPVRTPAQTRASRAANARWAKHPRLSAGKHA